MRFGKLNHNKHSGTEELVYLRRRQRQWSHGPWNCHLFCTPYIQRDFRDAASVADRLISARDPTPSISLWIILLDSNRLPCEAAQTAHANPAPCLHTPPGALIGVSKILLACRPLADFIVHTTEYKELVSVSVCVRMCMCACVCLFTCTPVCT